MSPYRAGALLLGALAIALVILAFVLPHIPAHNGGTP